MADRTSIWRDPGAPGENPTISIAPMQGEEFTQRLLTPFQEQKLTLLLRQGYDVDALLRLMGAEVLLQTDGQAGATAYHNRPSDRDGYQNYDPAVLSNEDLFRLHEEAEQAPFNDVLIDIRPEFAGGAMPLHGRLRLRSFHEILTFLGRGMAEEPEYDVAPDPRTASIRENPVHTLEIVATSRAPGNELSVQVNGGYYAVRSEKGYQWNRKVFSLLYQLFQMSVSTVVQTGPAITIAK